MSLLNLYVGGGGGGDGGGDGPTPGENECNSCDPAMPDTLYVTFSGLVGDCAVWNTENTATWWGGCHWYFSTYSYLYYYASQSKWQLYVYYSPTAKFALLSQTGIPCDPWDSGFSLQSPPTGICYGTMAASISWRKA